MRNNRGDILSPHLDRGPDIHPAKPGLFYGYVIVIASFLIIGATYGGYFAYGVFLKPVIAEFGWSTAAVSGAFSLSMIVHGTLGVFMGHYSDRVGPRVVIITCGIFLGIGYLLLSQIHELWQLYVYYGFFVGVGVSGGWVCLLSCIARWFKARRTLMSGIIMTGTGVGSAIIPPVANWFIVNFSWRTAFVCLGVAVLFIILGAAVFLKRDPSRKGLLPYGETEAASGISLARCSGSSLREAVRTNQFWLCGLVFLFFGMSMFIANVHIVAHAQDLGFSPASAASVLSVVGLASIGGRLFMGGVGDRIGNKRALMIGFTAMLGGLLWLLAARELWGLYFFAAIFGFAYGGIGVSQSPLTAWLFGLKSHGLILGATDFFFTTGASIGPLLAGYIFDVAGSYQTAFLVAGMCSATGLVLITLLRKPAV